MTLRKNTIRFLKICKEEFDKQYSIEELDNAPFICIDRKNLPEIIGNDFPNISSELEYAGYLIPKSVNAANTISVRLTYEGYYFEEEKEEKKCILPMQMTNCNIQQIVGNNNTVTQNNNSNLNELLETLLTESIKEELREVLLEIQNDNNKGLKNKQKWLDGINNCASIVTLAMASPIAWEYLQKLINFIQGL